MLSIAALAGRSGGGGGTYHQYLVEAYYAGDGESGTWFGGGAAKLGLKGKVTEKDFAKLFDGYGPGGKALVQNAGKAADRATGKRAHRPGWDLTFSTPKSVSVLWSVSDEDRRQAIERCHRAAVLAALGYLEDAAGRTRTGRGGSAVERCGLVVATYDHATSRELDPQLHAHSVVFNVGVAGDGTTRTVLSPLLYEHKMAAGALYRASLAAALVRDIGLRLVEDRHAFRVEGVPKELERESSKRRRQIEAVLQSWGGGTAAQAAAAARTTKRAKEVRPTDGYFAAWAAAAAEFGFTREVARGLYGKTRAASVERERAVAAGVVREAVADALARHSHFSERELARDAAHRSRDGRCGAEALRQGIAAELQRPEYGTLGPGLHGVRYTTREVWRVEESLLNGAGDLAATKAFGVSRQAVTKVLDRGFPLFGNNTPDDQKRNSEQRAAVEHLTGPAALAVLAGYAGTGKSTVLKACREVWEQAGYRVTGIALAGIAAKNLKESSGIESETLALRVKQLEAGGLVGVAWHHLKQLVKTAANELHRDVHLPIHKRFVLDAKTVVVLDEAGMVGTRQMGTLLEAVCRSGAKLVVVGDPAQLQSIDAGGPFQAIAKRVGAGVLTHVIRQRLDLDDTLPEWRREAVKLFAAGRVEEALKPFAARGRVSVTDTREEAQRALVADWLKAGGLTSPGKYLILAGTNEDVKALNARCQQARLNEAGVGLIQKGATVDGGVILPGDRVQFTKKSRRLGLDNGNLGTVSGTSGLPGFRTVTVDLDDGQSVSVPLRKYDSLRLGYAVTTHKAQGATCECSFVLLGGSMQDRHLSYVQASRARDETRFYTDKTEAGPGLSRLTQTMARDRTKDLAHDMDERDQSRRPGNRPRTP